MKQSLLLAMLVAALLALPSMATAEMVTAHFTDGNSDAVPDGYLGAPGAGWEDAWVARTTGSSSLNNTVVDTVPLDGGGNYLSYSQTHTSGTSAATACVSRDYVDATNPLIDVTKDFTIQFSVRIDEDIDGAETTFTGSNDRYLFHGTKVISTSTGLQAAANALYDIRVQAERPNDEMDGYWMAYDGVTMYQVGTKKATDGVVYDFTIDVDVEANTYDLTIVGNGETATKTMACRGTSGTWDGAVTFATVDHATTDHRAMSIDGIKISQVPEPGALVSLAAGLLGLLIRRK